MTLQSLQERRVEVEAVELENVRVRVLPDGRMDSNNAAKYLGRAPKTLAMWRLEGIGPPWIKCGGRIFYFKDNLDTYGRGELSDRREVSA
jgi:hypothetical protein